MSNHESDRPLRGLIWDELARACDDRNHQWRTPVLASSGSDGFPQARTVVLRQTDAERSELRIFTDRRSAKIAELSKRPHASLVFWSAALSWQLRIRCAVTIDIDSAEVARIWDTVKESAAASDSLAPAAPGTPLAPFEQTSTTDHHLAIIVASVLEMDWLELSRRGHRRARLTADTLTWLTP